MSRTAATMLVFALALCVASVHAQEVYNMMRGATQVADPAASTAWSANPATLAHGNAAGNQMGNIWETWAEQATSQSASLDLQLSGDGDYTSLNWARRDAANHSGWGGGYTETEADSGSAQVDSASVGRLIPGMATGDVDRYGIGYGRQLRSGLAAGISASVIDWGSDSETVFDIGVLSQATTDVLGRKVSWGAVLRDATDEIDRRVDLGAAVGFPGGWNLVADYVDLETLNIGASTHYGNDNAWEVAAGLRDGDLTLGAMRDLDDVGDGGWKVGVAWMDTDSDNVLVVGGSRTW